ncbi:conserved hypothetical protein [Rhodococcus jostii RHA1]|uniref:DUF1269 domain-containing family protein n=1 Tax=Rhodococcus jostii (strain RHA1) TaxID=101510 RepID=Q0S146_RHOJR|nr:MULTISPECIES: DUF6325 family protein [Rhodococcus]ABG98740.1 conserved hypothetical protein [Rhodococcus jostii RHA1]
MTDTDFDDVGPIDYLVVEFPADHPPDGSALPLLLDLVEANIIRVLDLVFVRKDADGSLAGIAVEDLGFTGTVDVTLFAEASSGLIDRGDLEQAGAVLEPGCVGAILVYENRWAAPFASALRREGAQLVASGRIPVQGTWRRSILSTAPPDSRRSARCPDFSAELPAPP